MQRSISQIYDDWRATLKKPDDSIFWYHPSIDSIILGLGLFCLAARPLLHKLDKAESLKLFDIHINELVTAWIDDNPEAFEFPFNTLITLSESLYIACPAFIKQYPRLKKTIEEFYYTFIYWVPIAGDIDDSKVQALLDTFTTDGKTIEADPIIKSILKIQPIILRSGLSLNPHQAILLFNKIFHPHFPSPQ